MLKRQSASLGSSHQNGNAIRAANSLKAFGLQRPSQRCRQSQSSHPAPRQCRRRITTAAESQQAESRQEESEEALTDKMAEFLRQQAEKESGGQLAVPEDSRQEVLGSDEVSEEDAKRYCREIVAAVRQLRQKRDMSINEIKLTLAIEDPTLRERRDYLGIEEGEGVSRDDIAAALLEVTAGRIPLDRIALRELSEEVKTWPYLDAEEQLEAETGTASNYEGITDTGVQKKRSAGWNTDLARPPVGRDKEEAPQSFTDMLPDWFGYGFLYFVTIIPAIIVVITVSIVFISSLK